MNPGIIVLWLVIGAAVGAVVTWLFAQARVAKTQGELVARKEEVEQLEGRIEQMNARIDELNAALRTEGEKRAAAEATLEREREAAKEQLKLIEEAKKVLSDTFKALSDEALKSNNQAFIQLAKSTMETFQAQATGDLTERQKAIDALVQPLKEALKRYEKQMAQMAKDRSGQYQSLQDQVRSLLQSEQSLRDETGKLVTALSAPQVRGHWGEITLRRVAELAGMVERCDFVEQESTDTPSGRLRPDMIVNLPSGRRIVVDAKAPLKAYVEAVEATSEEARTAKLREHARQVKTRAADLSRKEYWDQFEEAPEFVVLFLPGEQFLGAALQEDPDLLENAFRQRVILATPTTLIALLKAVAYGWRQEALAENAQKISELGKQLYERLSTLAGHFQDLGRSLDRSVEAYNRAVGSFETRVMVSARKFKELGATGAEDLPAMQPIEQTSRQMLPIGYEVEDEPDRPSGQA